MKLLYVVILALVQGLAELLPVSSSAHVVVAEKLMGLDPSLPEVTFLLVMLHSGTMVAVIVYFWKLWRKAFFANVETFKRSALQLFLASAVTALVGALLIKGVEKIWLRGTPNAEVEQLFSHLKIIAPALALVGVLILVAGILERRSSPPANPDGAALGLTQAGLSARCRGFACPSGDFRVLAQPFRRVCWPGCRNFLRKSLALRWR
jgi:undecaprenyl-diphosphatase